MQTDVNFSQLTIPNKLLGTDKKTFLSQKNYVLNIHYSVVQKILEKGCYTGVYEFSELKVLRVYSVMVNRGFSQWA